MHEQLGQQENRSWWVRLNRALFPYMGPAQLGAGHPEQPYRPAEHATCPLCGGDLAAHTVIRSADQAHATRLVCP